MPRKELTVQERIEAHTKARELIKSQGNWVKGDYKCPIYERGHDSYVPRGEPIGYAYCIMGAEAEAVGINPDMLTSTARDVERKQPVLKQLACDLKDHLSKRLLLQLRRQEDLEPGDACTEVMFTVNDAIATHRQMLVTLDRTIAGLKKEAGIA